MKAVLIEIDRAVIPPMWYATYAGARLWCQPARELMGDDGWVVLPGQGVPESLHNVIFSEHAWQVREGEVELLLVEIEPSRRQGGLPLEPTT